MKPASEALIGFSSAFSGMTGLYCPGILGWILIATSVLSAAVFIGSKIVEVERETRLQAQGS